MLKLLLTISKNILLVWARKSLCHLNPLSNALGVKLNTQTQTRVNAPIVEELSNILTNPMILGRSLHELQEFFHQNSKEGSNTRGM